LLEAFLAAADAEVYPRVVAAAGDADFFIGRLVVVPFRGDFRAVEDGFLRHFLERHAQRACFGRHRQHRKGQGKQQGESFLGGHGKTPENEA
jgi:hypothetical protein